MCRPLILSLLRGVLSGTILIAFAATYAQSQVKRGVLQGDPSPPLEPASTTGANLPDSPGTVLRRRQPTDDSAETASMASSEPSPKPSSDEATTQQPSRAAALTEAAARASDQARPSGCSTSSKAAANGTVELKPDSPGRAIPTGASPTAPAPSTWTPTCPSAQNPYQRFLNSTTPIPLTPRQKAYLAVHNFLDPGNIVTILGTSGVAIASNAHTAYGPGWHGFGRDAGISAVQDATGDFFGTFLIPSLVGEDPHYHRMPGASIPRRTLHAISRTVVAQGDDGHPMPNYSTLLTYPITAEIANLYVPGVATNGPSTVERVLTGYATDPIDNLITEFLPDVAKRIHVRVIFVQQIINQVAAGQSINMFP